MPWAVYCAARPHRKTIAIPNPAGPAALVSWVAGLVDVLVADTLALLRPELDRPTRGLADEPGVDLVGGRGDALRRPLAGEGERAGRRKRPEPVGGVRPRRPCAALAGLQERPRPHGLAHRGSEVVGP